MDAAGEARRLARNRWRRVLLGLFGLAFGARMTVLAVVGIDERHASGYRYYVEMADNLRAGRGLHREMPYGQGERRAIRTPLYPLVLAALRSLPVSFGLLVSLVGAACGAVTVVLVALLARGLFGTAAGCLAGLAVGLWPYGVVHDTAIQDTALYTALFAGFVLACWGLTRRPGAGGAHVLAVGLVGAGAVLTRVALLPSVLGVMAWCVVARPAPGAGSARRLALLLLGLALGLAPWLTRNALVVGAPVLTSDTGRSCWLGNNPETFSVYPTRSIDRAEERAWAALPEATRRHVRELGRDELAADAWFREQALAWVRRHPRDAARGAWRKVAATFGPRFNPEAGAAKAWAHALWYLPVALLAVAALVAERRRLRELAFLPGCVVILALQSAVFFGHSGYRAYLDPLLAVLAAGLAARIAGWRRDEPAP